MRCGQRSYIPGVGHIHITSVEPVEIGALTNADAIPDGFETAAALPHELRTIYGGKLAQGYHAFRIAFERESNSASESAYILRSSIRKDIVHCLKEFGRVHE